MKDLAVIIILFLLLTSGCTRARNESPIVAHVASPSPTVLAQPSPSPTPESPIRKIDFRNFTYASNGIYGEAFTLKDGEHGEPDTVSFVDSVYGDVTGDRGEEALIVLFHDVRGSAIPYYVYVYGITREQPKLLWSFETGDRAQGGLRRAFAENGQLVVELYGKDTHLDGDLYAGSRVACCAEYYTRSRYEWKRNRFRQVYELEVLPAEGHGSYLHLLDDARLEVADKTK